MGASPVPPKRSKAEPAPPPNPAPPGSVESSSFHPPKPRVIPTKRGAPRGNLLSFAYEEADAIEHPPPSWFCRCSLRQKPDFALLQPRSGEKTPESFTSTSGNQESYYP